METSIDEPTSEKNEFEYADFGIRMLAFLVDMAIYTAIGWLIWGDEVVQMNDAGFQVNFNNEKFLVPSIYLLGAWISLSTSPGKLLFRLYIVNEDGKRISIARSILRYLGYFLIVIGCWFILGTKRKQALHDLVAKTYVIRR